MMKQLNPTSASSSQPPLLLILAISATLELIFNRIGIQLMSSEERGELYYKIIDLVGFFSFNFSGILGLITFSWAVVVFIFDPNLLHKVERIGMSFLSALFLPLAAMGVWGGLPQLVRPILNVAFGLVFLLLVVSYVRKPTPVRSRLGVIYLTAPILLHCYWLLTQQVPALMPQGEYSEFPNKIFIAAEHLVVVGAIAAFLFFAPYPRLSNLLKPLPVGVSFLVTGLVSYLTWFHYLESAQAAYYGLGINLPHPSGVVRVLNTIPLPIVLLYMVALFAFVTTIASLAVKKGTDRNTAMGLYLIGISGFHLQLPLQLLLTLLGLTEMIHVGFKNLTLGMKTEEQAPTVNAWGAFFSRLAAVCSSSETPGESVQLQNGARTIAHIRGVKEEWPFTLRVELERGEVEKFEVIVGRSSKEPPSIVLLRNANLRGKKVSKRGPGSSIKLQNETLNRQFSVYDSSGQIEQLLSVNGVSSKALRLIHGWLGIWPREGLHYIMQPNSDGWPLPTAEIAFSPEDASTEEIEELLSLLTQFAEESKA